MGPGDIDFGGIGTVITALTGVLLTAGTVLTSRQRHSQINAGAAMEEASKRAIQYQAAARHVSYLETIISERNGTVPARPVEMSAAWWAEAIGLDLSKQAPAAKPPEPPAAAEPDEAPDAGPETPPASAGRRRHGK